MHIKVLNVFLIFIYIIFFLTLRIYYFSWEGKEFLFLFFNFKSGHGSLFLCKLLLDWPKKNSFLFCVSPWPGYIPFLLYTILKVFLPLLGCNRIEDRFCVFLIFHSPKLKEPEILNIPNKCVLDKWTTKAE